MSKWQYFKANDPDEAAVARRTGEWKGVRGRWLDSFAFYCAMLVSEGWRIRLR